MRALRLGSDCTRRAGGDAVANGPTSIPGIDINCNGRTRSPNSAQENSSRSSKEAGLLGGMRCCAACGNDFRHNVGRFRHNRNVQGGNIVHVEASAGKTEEIQQLSHRLGEGSHNSA